MTVLKYYIPRQNYTKLHKTTRVTQDYHYIHNSSDATNLLLVYIILLFTITNDSSTCRRDTY